MKETNLLPCPFCGSEPKIMKKDHSGDHFIMCPKCRTRQSNVTTLKRASDVWNNRVTIGDQHFQKVIEGRDVEIEKLKKEREVLKGDVKNLQNGNVERSNEIAELNSQIAKHEAAESKVVVLKKKIERLEGEIKSQDVLVEQARAEAFREFQQQDGW